MSMRMRVPLFFEAILVWADPGVKVPRAQGRASENHSHPQSGRRWAGPARQETTVRAYAPGRAQGAVLLFQIRKMVAGPAQTGRFDRRRRWRRNDRARAAPDGG